MSSVSLLSSSNDVSEVSPEQKALGEAIGQQRLLDLQVLTSRYNLCLLLEGQRPAYGVQEVAIRLAAIVDESNRAALIEEINKIADLLHLTANHAREKNAAESQQDESLELRAA